MHPAEVLYGERTGFRGRSGRRIDSSQGDQWRLADRAVFRRSERVGPAGG